MSGVNNRRYEDRAEEIAEDYFVLKYSHPFEDVGGGVGGLTVEAMESEVTVEAMGWKETVEAMEWEVIIESMDVFA